MNPLLTALVQAGLMPKDDADRLERQMDSALAREFAEQQMLLNFGGALSAQRDRLVDAVQATDGLFPLAQQNRLWAGENELLWASVRDTVLDVASERATVATINVGGLDTWNLVNEGVIDWAETYYIDADGDTFGSVPNLNLTSRTTFERAFVEWQRGELVTAGFADGLPNLIRSLENVFGAVRAEAIGVTETSRIFAMAQLTAARENEFVTHILWETSRDERVCVICRPRQGSVVGKETEGFRVATDAIVGFPPAHVRCRCAISILTGPALEALREEGFIIG